MGKNIKIFAYLNILGAVILLVSWCLIPFLMGQELSQLDFAALVANPAWIPLNSLVFLSCLLILAGLPGIYMSLGEKAGIAGTIGFILAMGGIAWFTAIQYYETLLWPLIAAESAELFAATGFTPQNSLIFSGLMASGVLWAAGFILLGIRMIRSGVFPKWTGYALLFGSLIYGLGMSPMLRTIGLFPFCAALIYAGRIMISKGEKL